SAVSTEVNPTVRKLSISSSVATGGAVARSTVSTDVTLIVGELSISSSAATNRAV
ncbi:hypothetical protein NDU88_008016, partial [Pleurodeles waltl]